MTWGLLVFSVANAAELEWAVDIQTVEPQIVTGRLVSFSLREGAMVLADHLAPSLTGLGADHVEKMQIPTSDIIRMTRRTGAPGSQGGAAQAELEGELAERLMGRSVSGDRAAPTSEPWTITLTWGDVLRGRVTGGHGETVILETADLGEIPIPLESIARFVSGRAGAAAATPLSVGASGSLHGESLKWLDRGSAERSARSLVGGSYATSAPTPVSVGARDQLLVGGNEAGHTASETDDDLVLLTNGDVLRGFIRSIDADGIAIDTGAGPTRAPFRLVVAARMAHALPPPTPRPYLRLTLRDGARLTATGLDIGPIGPMGASLRGGATVQVVTDRVVAVEVIGGRWEWLTDHRPISYEQSPMLGPGWDYVHGGSVLNGPILVAGESYQQGIGVHSRSNLVFELSGEYREFVTMFGLDDDGGPLADVTVVILVDGQRRFEKAHIRRGNLEGPIRVDVSHAGRIELIVEYGDNGDMQDRFDWVEPGLIRRH